mgnify:CR=1 FL=1
MTRVLKSMSQLPQDQDGDVTSAVIFLHGYGANGADLMGLVEVLADHMPGTLFLAPDAPKPQPSASPWPEFPGPHRLPERRSG